MKRFTRLLFVISCPICFTFIAKEKAYAQFRYSFLGGYSADSYKGKNISLGDNYIVGVEAEKSISLFGAVSAGVYYKKGGYVDNEALEYLQYGIFTDLKTGTLRVDQIVIPIEYRIYLMNVMSRKMYFLTGMETRIPANAVITESIYKEDGSGQFLKESYNLNINSYSKKLEPLFVFGFGWNFIRRLKFQSRYCIGLSNGYYDKLSGNIPFSDSDSHYLSSFNRKIKQGSIQFLLGFQF